MRHLPVGPVQITTDMMLGVPNRAIVNRGSFFLPHFISLTDRRTVIAMDEWLHSRNLLGLASLLAVHFLFTGLRNDLVDIPFQASSRATLQPGNMTIPSHIFELAFIDIK